MKMIIIKLLSLMLFLVPAGKMYSRENFNVDFYRGVSMQEIIESLKLDAPDMERCEFPVPEPSKTQDVAPKQNIPIGNFGVVSKNIYRGERLDSEQDYIFLAKQLGVNTVVNLRYWHHEDKKLCQRYGLNCVDYSVMIYPGLDLRFDYETLKAAFRFVLKERRAGKKVYFHCLHGSDRTGALASAIMIEERACGVAFDKDRLWNFIQNNLQAYGFHAVYGSLYKTIKSWVYDLNDNKWLCESLP